MDPTGRYLDLTAEDLEVVENGVAQGVETFQEAVQPVSIVLRSDASGSMRKKEADVVASAREFISDLRPEDQLALMLFSDRATFAHDFSTDQEFACGASSDYKSRWRHSILRRPLGSLARLKRSKDAASSWS